VFSAFSGSKEALTKLAIRYDEAYREVVLEFGLDGTQNALGIKAESRPAIDAEVEVVESKPDEQEKANQRLSDEQLHGAVDAQWE